MAKKKDALRITTGKNKLVVWQMDKRFTCALTDTCFWGKYNGWAFVKADDKIFAINYPDVVIDLKHYGINFPEKTDVLSRDFDLYAWLAASAEEILYNRQFLSILPLKKLIEYGRKLEFDLPGRIPRQSWQNFFNELAEDVLSWSINNVDALNSCYDLHRLVGDSDIVFPVSRESIAAFKIWAKRTIETLLMKGNASDFEQINSIIKLAVHFKEKLQISGNARIKYVLKANNLISSIVRQTTRKMASFHLQTIIRMAETIGAKLELRPVLDFIGQTLKDKMKSEFGKTLDGINFRITKSPYQFALNFLKNL
jgi:hypothetical protein